MNAIELLETQHREVEKLFEDIRNADEVQQLVLAEGLAELLTIHATIEEQIFYPSVKNERTMPLLEDSVQEHLEVKRATQRLLESDPEEGQFMPLFEEIRRDVMDHVKVEENELFPAVREFCDDEMLDELGGRMAKLAADVMKEEDPVQRIPFETDTPAPI